MHIQFFINERDYRSAALLAMRKRSNLSSLDYYGPYIVAVVWIAASVFPNLLNGNPEELVDLLLTFGVIPLVMGILMMRRKNFKREFSKLRNLHPLQALDIDGIGFRLVTNDTTVRTDWKLYSKFAEDKECFVLFQAGSILFLPIPKSNLTIPQVDELHSLLGAHLPLA